MQDDVGLNFDLGQLTTVKRSVSPAVNGYHFSILNQGRIRQRKNNNNNTVNSRYLDFGYLE